MFKIHCIRPPGIYSGALPLTPFQAAVPWERSEMSSCKAWKKDEEKRDRGRDGGKCEDEVKSAGSEFPWTFCSPTGGNEQFTTWKAWKIFILYFAKLKNSYSIILKLKERNTTIYNTDFCLYLWQVFVWLFFLNKSRLVSLDRQHVWLTILKLGHRLPLGFISKAFLLISFYPGLSCI